MLTIETLDRVSSSALIVKDAILARSGIYIYSYEEVIRRGINPEVKKDFYREYRPPAVLVEAKDKFKYAPLTKEHPYTISTDNIKQVIEGVVGSEIEVVTLDNGEIALKGEIAFFTTEAVDYYLNGAKETSAQYVSNVSQVYTDDFDFILNEIVEVKGLALTRRGRGGPSVSVLDSLLNDKIQGVNQMKNLNSILSFFGVGKSPEEVFVSSVMDSLRDFDKLNDSEKRKKIETVEQLVSSLPESKERQVLLDTVKDCFQYPKEVLETEKVGQGLKTLYSLCSSKSELLKTLDSIKEKDSKKEEEKEEEEKDSKKEEEKDLKKEEEKEEEKDGCSTAKDSISFNEEELIEKIVTKVTDSLLSKVDEIVKKNLGIEEKNSTQTTDSILTIDENTSFLLKNMFK